MHYEKERQEHNEQDWPSDERMNNIGLNGGEALHYPKQKKYKIIYADPPWQFNNKKTGGSMSSGSASQYMVTDIESLKKLDVNSIADNDCTLIMWWVGSMPQEALDLVSAWGFTVKNMNGFVWRKLTKNFLDFFGMGFRTRAGSESAIIAVKGKPKVYSHSVRAVQSIIAGRHSEKPGKFRDLIIELCGDLPRLEMFAREATEGWDVFGNEAQNSIKITNHQILTVLSEGE